MIKPEYISRIDTQSELLQYEELIRQGILFAEQLSGAIWTDYNEHDPGVTILENMCFALTDLIYRTNFTIPELIFSRPKNEKEVNNAFFLPNEILPTGTLTLVDYRKLIIDRIPKVQNAWIEPLENHHNKYKGLYQVLLEVRDEDEFSYTQIKKDTWASVSYTHLTLPTILLV